MLVASNRQTKAPKSLLSFVFFVYSYYKHHKYLGIESEESVDYAEF